MPGVDRPDITMEVIMAEKHIIDPTERSMPPVMITKVMPRVAMAMKEKFFATFCMLPCGEEVGARKMHHDQQHQQRQQNVAGLGREDAALPPPDRPTLVKEIGDSSGMAITPPPSRR